MGKNSKIAWTDHTFSPWWGCYKNSPECANCYASAFSKRTGHEIWGENAPRRFFGDKHWAEPLKWNRDAKASGVRARVFCASMCDVMEAREDLVASRDRLYSLIEQTEWLDWLLLTKFPQHFNVFLPLSWLRNPRPNVWGMTTVGCNSSMWRIRELLNTPFTIRGLSCEPLLEEINLRTWLRVPTDSFGIPYPGRAGRIDWVIAGAESGAKARPMNEDWVRSLRDQCEEAGVAFFYKQNVINGIKIETPILDECRWMDYPNTESRNG